VLPALVLAVSIAVALPAQGQLGTSDLASQRIAEGFQALEVDDLEGAAGLFREALALAPDAEPALLGLSQVFERQGNLVEALALARRALDIVPASPPTTLAVARLLARLGDSTQALENLARLKALDPEEKQGYLLSALLLRDLARRDEAIEVLEEALARDLPGPQLEEELAMLLLAADRPGEARRLAEEALTEYGERASLQLALGLALAADPTSRGEAVPPLERALELGIHEPGRVHLELGSLLLEAGRPEEALEHFSTAAELMPDTPEVFYKLGAAQRAAGDATAARQSLIRFQELKGQREQQERLDLEIGTALNEAQALATANRLTEALESAGKILADDPDEARTYTLRAKILYSLRRPEDALADAVRARQLDPTRVEPHYLEGMFLLHLSRPEEARAALLQAVTLDPNLGEAHELLGGAAAKLGRPLEAASHFERALELGVDGPGLRLGYAAALESLGRLDESVQQMDAYRRLVRRPQ